MSLNQETTLHLALAEKELLRRITSHIHRPLELQQILAASVADLREFLTLDRVKIYKFHPDGSGQVIAESINHNRLPSLLGLNFSSDEIPPDIRELFLKSRVRSMVNVDTRQIRQNKLVDSETGEAIVDETDYRPVDPCHVEYLTAMGVYSSLVVPIVSNNQLWGLVASHHSQPRKISPDEIEAVQKVADLLSGAIAQTTLLTITNQIAKREATLKRIATILHSLPTVDYQPALTEAVAMFAGSGGRLCIRNQAFNQQDGTFMSLAKCLEAPSDRIKVYTYGKQPAILENAKYPLMEQYSVWQEEYNNSENRVWGISDIYKTPSLENLYFAFEPTKIRSILMIPLEYRQQLVGYLSIFRDEVNVETLWAGEFDPDRRQLFPRRSFDAWRESKKSQAQQWTNEEIKLANQLAEQFAAAIYNDDLNRQVHQLDDNNKIQLEDLKNSLPLEARVQQILLGISSRIRADFELDAIFQTASKETCDLLQTERIAVYRFSDDWGGEFVEDFGYSIPQLSSGAKFGSKTVWNDTYLQLTQGGRYRNNDTFAVDDIYEMAFNACHLEILEQFNIKAFAIVPIFAGHKLWGLLAAYQHSKPRQWLGAEIKTLSKIAAQLGIAIQQTELVSQSQKLADDLRFAARKEQLLFEIVAKIRAGFDLDIIFKTTIQEVSQLLNAERIAVYRFFPDWGGEFVEDFEYSTFKLGTLAKFGGKSVWNDTYLQQTQGGRYRHNETFVVDDIYQMGFNACHVEILEQFRIKAFAIVPIFAGPQLWGLLAAYHHSQPRHWLEFEVKLLSKIAAQLGVAIQHTELVTQTQKLMEDLKSTTKKQQILLRVINSLRKSVEIPDSVDNYLD